MAIRNANKGFSLIECLVALILSLVAIGIIGSLFISAQKVANERNQQLYLLQSLATAFQTIEDDLRRAGFDNYDNEGLTLASSSSVVELASESDFGLAYYREMGDGHNYRSVRYYLSDNKIIACEQGVVSKEHIKLRLDIASCRSMLDERVHKVMSFGLTAFPLASSAASSVLWRLSISAQTQDSRYAYQLVTNVKQRNWQ